MTEQQIIGVCHTDGNGLWTMAVAAVRITGLELAYLDADSLIESTFGELRVHFDKWEFHGELIYTDELWISEFRQLLKKFGFSERAVEAVDYSEMGMQGADYVSLDVGDPFIVECDPFINFIEGKKPKKISITVTAY